MSARLSFALRRLRPFVAVALFVALLLPAAPVQAATVTVCPTGGDHAAIQAAIDAAQPGDTISICSGHYLENITLEKDLTLQGEGPGTRIDGQDLGSVVFVAASATVTLRDLEIVNGTALEDEGWSTGGGVHNEGRATLDRVTVMDNVAYEGAGVANEGLSLTIRNSTFFDNFAEMGGAVSNRGPYGGVGLTIIENSFIAANTATVELFEWDHDDAGAGGALYNNIDDILIVDRTVLQDNYALRGGALSNAEGFSDAARVYVIESYLLNNGAAYGGAIQNYGVLDVAGSTVEGNIAQGRGESDSGFGGGILNHNVLRLTNSTLSANEADAPGEAAGGLGGGLFNGGEATLTHATVAYNVAGGGGSGVYAANWSSGDQAYTTLSNSIVALNDGTPDCGGDASFVFYGWGVLDSDGSCVAATGGGGTGDPLLGPLADNGGPTPTHALQAGSPALDAAPYCLLNSDQRRMLRPQGTACDLGAFEAAQEEPPPAAPLVYLSTGVSGAVGSFAFGDEDIVAYNTDTEAWAKYFDGSDMGLQSNDLDAFEFLPNGDILMSFSADTPLPGITGMVADEDIVRFVPTSVGEQTAGSFQWHLDGSDVGLAPRGSDVDAIATTAAGALAVSTRADVNAPELAFKDEDLVQLGSPVFGESSAGSWSLFFDGSDVGLDGSNDEDVKGAWVDPATAAIHLTTLGNFSVPGVNGAASDILACASGSTGAETNCTFSLFWRGADAGFTLPIDGLQIGGGAQLAAVGAGSAGAEEPITLDEEALDDDLEEEMEVEGSAGVRVFLPAVNK